MWKRIIIYQTCQKYAQICSCIKKLTMNLIASLKTSIHVLKDTQHTQLHFRFGSFPRSIFFNFLDMTFHVFSPQHNVEGLRLSWPWPCLPSLLDFPFLDPLGKTAGVVFVRTPFWALLTGLFFEFSYKNHRKSPNMCFFLICLPTGWRLLLTPGMWMGGGPFGTIWGSFQDHFEFILGPPCQTQLCFSTKKNFAWNGTY